RAKTETQSGELEQARVELKRLQADEAKWEQRQSELKQELELSRSAVGEAEAELAKRDDLLRDFEKDERARRAEAEALAGELEHELEIARGALSAAESRAAELDQVRSELEKLRADQSGRKQRQNDLERELELVRDGHSAAEAALAERDDRLRRLEEAERALQL